MVEALKNDPARESVAPRPSDTDRVEVVATYEEDPTGNLPLPILSDPYSEMAAAFRTLRHRVAALEASRVIAITSPDREEGKTTLALNLALAFAEHGLEDVLLIEANLHQPALAQALGFAPPACFAQQMQQVPRENSRNWQAVATYFDNLHVLAVDPSVTEPSMVKGLSFTNTMKSLARTGYQRIIVDCPAVNGAADMSVIQDCVNGLLFVGRAGMTRASSLSKAAKQLQPVTVFGNILLQG